MRLKQQTVYVPIESSCPTIVIKETYGDIGARKEENKYILSGKDIVELLTKVWEEAELSTVNSTEPTYEDSQCLTDWAKTRFEKEIFINSIINQ